jgi:hypothetical protein
VPKARPLRRIYGPDADIGAKAMDVALCRLKRRMANGGIPFVVYTGLSH